MPMRTALYADPAGLFLDDVILEACRKYAAKTAIIDVSSCTPTGFKRMTYAEYGETVEVLARGLIAAGLQPGDVVAIYLTNSWEFCVTFHAVALAGGASTLLNPSYREREVRYQLETSDAAMLITDASNIAGMNLSGLPKLRRVYTTRQHCSGTEPFASLLQPGTCVVPTRAQSSDRTIAALPFSSGTTGLPKGVMLSHFNLVANIFQIVGPNAGGFTGEDVVLGFLPLYHIYGLNVVLSPVLTLGGTLVLMPRFHPQTVWKLMVEEGISMIPVVPPALNVMCQAAEAGEFPRDHSVRWAKSGAAPLAGELARRFTALTGILVCQGYGMTEASPVTHLGYLQPELYRPESIGQPVAQTDCRVVDENGACVTDGQPGELVMRGPQFMLGYWKEPGATEAAIRDGWYWSGDVVTRSQDGFYYVLDRRKEMIKFKGFAVAPAEVESVLLEHPAVRDCGVVGRSDKAAGEVPVAFVSLRDGFAPGRKLEEELCTFVSERITSYKQPREIRFVPTLPRTPSGKILRRELRAQL